MIEQGDVARAREALDSVSAIAHALDSTAPKHTSYFDALARVLLAEGEAHEAVQGLEALGRYLGEVGIRNPALLAASQAALALLRLDRSDEGRRYAAEELALAREWGAPRALGKSLVAAGLVEGGEDGSRCCARLSRCSSPLRLASSTREPSSSSARPCAVQIVVPKRGAAPARA